MKLHADRGVIIGGLAVIQQPVPGGVGLQVPLSVFRQLRLQEEVFLVVGAEIALRGVEGVIPVPALADREHIGAGAAIEPFALRVCGNGAEGYAPAVLRGESQRLLLALAENHQLRARLQHVAVGEVLRLGRLRALFVELEQIIGVVAGISGVIDGKALLCRVPLQIHAAVLAGALQSGAEKAEAVRFRFSQLRRPNVRFCRIGRDVHIAAVPVAGKDAVGALGEGIAALLCVDGPDHGGLVGLNDAFLRAHGDAGQIVAALFAGQGQPCRRGVDDHLVPVVQLCSEAVADRPLRLGVDGAQAHGIGAGLGARVSGIGREGVVVLQILRVVFVSRGGVFDVIQAVSGVLQQPCAEFARRGLQRQAAAGGAGGQILPLADKADAALRLLQREGRRSGVYDAAVFVQRRGDACQLVSAGLGADGHAGGVVIDGKDGALRRLGAVCRGGKRRQKHQSGQQQAQRPADQKAFHSILPPWFRVIPNAREAIQAVRGTDSTTPTLPASAPISSTEK